MGNTFTLKLRKFVATLSLTTLLASMLVVPQASGANLDEAPSWARNAVEELADLSQSSLRLNDATDKCEFSKMLTVAFGLEEETLDPFTFTDVPEWAKGYVGAMVNNEIAKGDSATKFGCGAPMSRAVQVKMIVNALGLEEGTLDSKYDSEFAGVEWAKGAFAAALTEGIVKGDDSTGALRPAANANRAESFVLAYRAMGGDESEGEE
ncbi:S-layer homology domain-containing protein, partial [Candidatus Gracilibacteria bacterium]|nr:S-layer homology domain-containing protein [Candidatus Gracilibacteria bacterium]